MTQHTLDFFRDENPGVFRSHPLEVIRATTLALPQNPYVDSNDRIGAERVVFYNDPDAANPIETRLVLRMVEHAGGAWAKGAAIGTQSGPTEGRILHSDGEMAASVNVSCTQVQGALFADYYDLLQNRLQDARVVTAQQDGDLYWVVVEGTIELLAGTNALVLDSALVTSGDADGGTCEEPTTIGATDVGDESGNIMRNLRTVVIGYCLEAAADGAFGTCRLDIRNKGYVAF